MAARVTLIIGTVVFVMATLARPGQNKYDVKVPNDLAFSDFKGYESWQLVSLSQDNGLMAAIFANPTMIKANQDGIPANGKAFPDGSNLAKIHWNPQKMAAWGAATGTQHDADFMMKDSKRFADSGGLGIFGFRV